MNKPAIASDRPEIAIYIQEIAADREEIAANRPEMPANIEETGLNGLEAARRLKKKAPKITIIFLTMNEDRELAAAH